MINKSFDFIIIGAGLAGCALSHFLSKSGANVLVLEAGSICSGTSAACAGRAQIIESETDDYLSLVINGLSKLLNLQQELGVDLDWELPGHITLIREENQWPIYENKVHQLKRFGIPAEMLTPSDLKRLEPELCIDECIGAAFSQEGHLNPFKLCFGLAFSAQANEAIFYENSPVTGFINDSNRIIGVRSRERNFYGKTFILTTGAWTGELTDKLGVKIPINHTHAEALVTEQLPKLIHHHIGTSGFYEAVHGAERTISLGFAQHKNGTIVISNAIQPEEYIDRTSTNWGLPALMKSFSSFFPKLKNMRIIRTWAAPSPFTPDFLPAIGWYPGLENLYIACGFHLAIPTIPLLTEEIASQLIDSNNKNVKEILKPFNLERFFSKSVSVEPLTYG